ncbi:unnamed protein product [Chrysoparadoxa australica]
MSPPHSEPAAAPHAFFSAHTYDFDSFATSTTLAVPAAAAVNPRAKRVKTQRQGHKQTVAERLKAGGSSGPTAPVTKRNPIHRRRGRKGKSIYRGVCVTREGKWRAVIYKERKQLYLGVYESEIDAAQAHDRAAREHFRENAMVNFPLANEIAQEGIPPEAHPRPRAKTVKTVPPPVPVVVVPVREEFPPFSDFQSITEPESLTVGAVVSDDVSVDLCSAESNGQLISFGLDAYDFADTYGNYSSGSGQLLLDSCQDPFPFNLAADQTALPSTAGTSGDLTGAELCLVGRDQTKQRNTLFFVFPLLSLNSSSCLTDYKSSSWA